MPRDMEHRDKDNRPRGAPKDKRDAPSREDVDTSSVLVTLSRHQSSARDTHSQPEQPNGDAQYFEERQAGGGAHTPPSPRRGANDTVPATERGDSSLRLARDSGLRQPDGDGRRKQPRTGRQDDSAANAPTQENGTPPREDGGAAGDGAQRPHQPRLQFSQDETPPPRDGGVVSDRAKAARRRADKAASKLDQAREELPTTRRPRVEKTFDDQKAKMKRKLVFEEEVKSKRAHLRGNALTRPVNAGKNAAVGYAHKKIHEVEHENVGTEAAHKTELLAEGGLRTAYRAHKTAPYRRVARLERKVPRLQMKADYKQALVDNPKLKSNIFSRMAQKRKIKREYARLAREARKTGQRAKKAATATGNIAARIAGFVKRHPTAFLIIGILALLLIIIMTTVSSCSNMATSTMGAVAATSYLAEDADIDNAELNYTEWVRP